MGPGRIPVAHLQSFLTALNQVLQRTARVLQDGGDSVRRGQPPQALRQGVELTLVMLTHGSDAAVLGFDRTQTSPSLPGMDLGLEAMDRAVQGLASVQEEELAEDLPVGCDDGVLSAWRDAGKLLGQGVDNIEFTLAGEASTVRASLTPVGVARLERRLKEPEVLRQALEGRLLMGDFKESDTRCRVHPALGDPVECRFRDGLQDDVLRNLTRFVRVEGEAMLDPGTGRIRRFVIDSVESISEDGQEFAGAPVAQSFWDTASLEELALSQSVGPMRNVESLFHTWPGEEHDRFEELVAELRRTGTETAGGR